MSNSPIIHRSEWRWVVAWTIAILLFTSIPYLLGWWVASDAGAGLTFGGFVIGVEDGNSYLAKMGQGARGHWLFHIVYTSEPHDGRLFFLFHILLGKLAALLPGDAVNLPLRMIWVYHLARLVCAVGLLAVVYRFAAEFLPQVGMRRLVWLMVALGGGLGWLLLALGLDDWLGSMPLDFILPEGFTFLTIFSLPHIALGRALLLGGMLVWWKGVGGLGIGKLGNWGSGVLAGGLWLVMGLIVPFYPVVAGTVVVATLLALWLERRRFPGREMAFSILVGLLSTPVVFYSAWVFLTDPVMQGWSAQNLILSPHPLHYLAAYLAPGLLAAVGLTWIWRERPGEKYWLLVAWALVIPPLLYAPFNLQRRLIEGYQIPLYTLAVMGMAVGARRVGEWFVLPRHPQSDSFGRPYMAAALLLLMFPTSLMLVAGSALAVTAGQPPIFHSSEEVETAAWLTVNAPEGALVLSDYPAGNFLPAWSPARSYYGHGPETIDFAVKKANVGRFYAAGTGDDWRREFLAANGVRYVLHGPAKRVLGGFEPGAYLKRVFEEGGWVLYEVVGDGD